MPRSSTSPRGRAASGQTESMRGSGRISGADCERGRGIVGDLEPNSQNRCYTQSIQPGGYIIENNAPAFGQPFKLTHRKRFGYIEETKKDECDETVDPVGRAEEES